MKLVTSKKQGGFTLVELVMVIVVIAMLSAYLGPKFASLEKQARVAQLNKISGSIAEALQVVKAISITELDASVAETIGSVRTAVTAVDYDGSDTTGSVLLTGEDIQTEYHYPKAISSTVLAGATIDSATVDSILQALVAFNTTVTVYDSGSDDEGPTIDTVVGHCGATLINNDGDASDKNSFVAYEIPTAAAGALPAGTDAVVIFPCSVTATEQFSAFTAAQTATADSARDLLQCHVQYNDAGKYVSATVADTFQLPAVTTVVTGC